MPYKDSSVILHVQVVGPLVQAIERGTGRLSVDTFFISHAAEWVTLHEHDIPSLQNGNRGATLGTFAHESYTLVLFTTGEEWVPELCPTHKAVLVAHTRGEWLKFRQYNCRLTIAVTPLIIQVYSHFIHPDALF